MSRPTTRADPDRLGVGLREARGRAALVHILLEQRGQPRDNLGVFGGEAATGQVVADEKTVRDYIRRQETEDYRLVQLGMFEE